jgi:3'(2'), 5'-bisphosphate nucleotidase
MAYDTERAAAVDAVRKACQLGQAVQERFIAGTELKKGDKSPVTVADYGAQAIVSALLHGAFPHDPLVGEEDAAALRDPANAALKGNVIAAVNAVLPDLAEADVLGAIDRGVHAGGAKGRFWALDPVDGTKGFLRMEQYAVALALVEDGEVVLGVLGCPNLPHDLANESGGRGCLFVAVRDQGASWRPLSDGASRAAFVDGVTETSAARLTESVESGHTAQDESAVVAQALGIERPPIRMDSQCKYAAVARGDASIYLRLPTRNDYVERIWDHAAGWRIVTEAGGKVTDVRGKPLDFGRGRGLEANAGVVVTNGALHDRVLAAVGKVLGV